MSTVLSFLHGDNGELYFAVTEHHLFNSSHLFSFSFLEYISHPTAFERPAVFLVYNPLITSISSSPVSQSIFLSFLSPHFLPQKETSNQSRQMTPRKLSCKRNMMYFSWNHQMTHSLFLILLSYTEQRLACLHILTRSKLCSIALASNSHNF